MSFCYRITIANCILFVLVLGCRFTSSLPFHLLFLVRCQQPVVCWPVLNHLSASNSSTSRSLVVNRPLASCQSSILRKCVQAYRVVKLETKNQAPTGCM